MATPQQIRRLAFQALYQLDARPDETPEVVLASVMTQEDTPEGGDRLSGGDHVAFREGDRKKAVLLASQAFAHKAKADEFMFAMAPDWPVHRQAAVDRAILRLAYYEITSGKTPPKIAVNEAVELAKEFSTDKSPAFINGLLDKALKVALLGQPLGANREAPAMSEERSQD